MANKKIRAHLINPEGGRPHGISVDPDELRIALPVYKPLLDILQARSPDPEIRAIPARELRIDPKFKVPVEVVASYVEHFQWHALQKEEQMSHILVMERSDGSLWVYDDTPYVQAAWEAAPDKPLVCAVWRDPTS